MPTGGLFAFLASVALGVPIVLVVVALVLVRHRDGPVVHWLRAHARGLMLLTALGYLMLGVLRLLDQTPGSRIAGFAQLAAGLALVGGVVLGYPPPTDEASRSR